MSDEEKDNINSKLLCRALRSMLEMNMMNVAMWIQASNTPKDFVKFFDDHWEEMQQEFEKKTAPNAMVTPKFTTLDATNGGVTPLYGSNYKITFIKMVRQITGWGLADSKYFSEALPKDFPYFYFHSQSEAEDSQMARWCRRYGIGVEWVPYTHKDGQPNIPHALTHRDYASAFATI